jgi:hypothetical protein
VSDEDVCQQRCKDAHDGACAVETYPGSIVSDN